MKLKEGFIVHSTDSESFLVPAGGVGFSGLVKGNAVLGDILKLLEKGATAEELTKALGEKYDAPPEKLRRDVDRAIRSLREIGAIESE